MIQPAKRMDSTIIAVAGNRPGLRAAVWHALIALTTGSGRVLVPDRHQDHPDARQGGETYKDVVQHCRDYLDSVLPTAELAVIHADTPAELPEAISTHLRRIQRDLIDPTSSRVLLFVDHNGTEAEPGGTLAQVLNTALSRLPDGVIGEVSLYATVVYAAEQQTAIHHAPSYTLRRPPADPLVWTLDIMCAVTDFVQARIAKSAAPPSIAPTTLARALHGFLTARAGATWGLHSYTGSVVSTMIADLERLATGTGNPVLRAPSEHGLACAAMARWLLDRAPFLIVVTSGMIDEFKGTLANLRQAGAQGFIVCADASGTRWFPFQGTIHANEDAREVVRARGLPVVHLRHPSQLATDLADAAEAYDSGRGPVVLFASPALLESTEPIDLSTLHAHQSPRRTRIIREDETAPVLRIINAGPARLLWQCGALADDERATIYELARRCGAALCDSLIHPGSVATWHHGQRVPEYLGTLALYGYSPAIHHYLHQGQRLRDRDEQCVFFLKSRITEIATPFTEQTLSTRLSIVQVTHDAEHIAPFTNHPVRAELAAFLGHLIRHVDVPQPLLEQRRHALAEALDTGPDLAGAVPTTPMTSTYFFLRLGAVLTDLIADGYTYTGVFDVGRGGCAAIRNLPRTGPGFSGWYGRALMGDALMAVPALALTRRDNVLAFVGDGAAALVPDVLPTLIQQVWTEGRALSGNVSVFRLLNGGQSLIRTYREARRGATADQQTMLINLVDEEWSRSFGPLTARHRRLVDIPEDLGTELVRPATVSLYSVLLAHTNAGDGIGPQAASDWRTLTRR